MPDNMTSAVAARDAIHVSSRYNFFVRVSNGSLLYNANTGSVLHLSGEDGEEVARVLSGGAVELDPQLLDQDFANQLIGGGFVVPSGTNELLSIQERFATARGETPLVLTLTTTMDCNLGCFYCYEHRTSERLTALDIPQIIESTRERLKAHPRRSLHVDWYGGEPLLNLEFMDACSVALQVLCREIGAAFSASVISNGTVWPEDVGFFIARHRIRQVQVTFDGMPENHNRRRRWIKSGNSAEAYPSFSLIVSLVDRLLDHVRVDLRFNTDRQNQEDLLPFVAFAKERGWFSRRFPAVVQPARLAAYTDKVSFLRRTGMTCSEYDEVLGKLRVTASDTIKLEESEAPDGFPYPRTSVCAALAFRSEVIGADGLKYRCGLQVGDRQRAIGSIREDLADAVFQDRIWWDRFDPTTLPDCSRCSFLPICWGGCPKRHLDKDKHALDEQSLFWRTNLPRLIASRFNLTPDPGFAYSETDQFR